MGSPRSCASRAAAARAALPAPGRIARRALRSAAALAIVVAARAEAQAPGAAAEIVAFRPEQRTLAPGGSAVSEVVVRGGRSALVVWVGYSVQDPAGRWYDIPARRMTLPAARPSPPQRLAWPVPAAAPAGDYRVVMAVWSAPPGATEARRLASADRAAAFRVRASAAAASGRLASWVAADHPLGRGRLRPGNVRAAGRGFRLRLPAGRCDGAEVRTRSRVGFGEYAARMRTPRAPGSLSALFLYQDVAGGNDEVDLEIYNDDSRRALLTSWIGGRVVRQDTLTLPFDPAAAPHDYTLRWTARELVFLADGRTLARWTGGYPRRRMRVVANVWWPTWLSCKPPAEARELEIEWLRLRPEAPAR